MTKVFSNNTTQENDYFGLELEKYGKDIDVFIATASFTDSRLVKRLVDNGCRVQLVIRLGFPTKAVQLKEIFNLGNVSIRYYTSSKFHPKLYIFGSKATFVGSSNLTDAGWFSNQELNVSIDPEDPAFDKLREIFQEYWNTAMPLTQEVIDKYSEIVSALDNLSSKADKEILDKIGLVEGETVKQSGHKKKKNPQVLFVGDFLRRYQLFLHKFDQLCQIYQSVGRRKVPEDNLPLKIEIDQFLSWIREEKAYGELYKEVPVKREKSSWRGFVVDNINKFLDTDFDLDHITNYSYPLIRANLASKNNIESLTEEDIKETVLIINAFYVRARFHGGKEALLKDFIQANGIDKIKKTLKHLLFDQGEVTQRMAECIFDPKYKLQYFVQSCIQETYGWANAESVPLCNERSIKSMQWLGFGEM